MVSVLGFLLLIKQTLFGFLEEDSIRRWWIERPNTKGGSSLTPLTSHLLSSLNRSRGRKYFSEIFLRILCCLIHSRFTLTSSRSSNCAIKKKLQTNIDVRPSTSLGSVSGDNYILASTDYIDARD